MDSLTFTTLHSHGFLPFKGLEIPIMVLQSKVFIISLLQRFSPHISKKRSFIRRVKERLSIRGDSSSVNSDDLELGLSDRKASSCDSSIQSIGVDGIKSIGVDECLTTTEAMKLFTKIPFPEPRLALHVNDRYARRDSDTAGQQQ